MKSYDKDDDGRWWVTAWSPQCPHKLMFLDRCQGVEGHEGDHWRYRDDGTYEWARDGEGGGWIAPPHPEWVSPVAKAPERYLCFHTTEEVTDPDLIAKLEAREVDAPITTPCTDADIEDLRRLGRLP